MLAYTRTDSLPAGWLAYELSVLRRIKFSSVAIPFAGESGLGFNLKRWGTRVAANDMAQWAWLKAVARIQNNTERLTEEDLETALEDVYVPRHDLNNAALLHWFNEPDAWWFDNLRANIAQLPTAAKRALALNLGMMVGDYVRSFDAETRHFQQPLSRIFRRLWEREPAPVDNNQKNAGFNLEARDFLAEQRADLLFLRLPRGKRGNARRAADWAWREEWVRGEGGFWHEMERARAERLGAPVETKAQYLRLVQDLLERAAHIKRWAIARAEEAFLTTEELVETIRLVRPVETIYTKDFSELLGARATIITV